MPTRWEDFERWFEHREIGIGGWSNAGVISLRGTKYGATIDSIGIYVYGVAPSAVCLSLMVRPSASFLAEIAEILNSDALRRVEVHLEVDGHRRQWHARERPPDQVRRRDVQAQLSRLNTEVSRLLCDYIGTGWSTEGRLPMLMIYVRELDPAFEVRNVQRQHGLWEAWNVPLWYPDRYEAEGGTLFWSVDRHREDFDAPTQASLLVDLPAFLAGKDLRGYLSPDAAVAMTVQSRFGSLAIPLALDEALRRMAAQVRRARRELAPFLTSGSEQGVRVSTRFSVAGRIEAIAFQMARLAAECDPEKLVMMVLRPNTVQLDRTGRGGEQNGSFLADWPIDFTRRLQSANSALRVLRDALNTALNLKLQRVTLRLTVVATALTFIATWLAVPQEWRESLLRWLWERLSGR
jgi:hypothetical protein